MQIIRDPAEMTGWSRRRRAAGRSIGFVPTMGFFHQGHLALMKRAARQADRVVVSLFVNPTQFGPNEDLAAYPRDFERDCTMAEETAVDVLFAPDAETMYPSGSVTTVNVSGLTDTLCGASRPGHFTGVATVVTKLFNIVRPDIAVFGQKDFQQLAVIRRMTEDLNLGVKIISHPIVREPDGLAMSSRNTYLTPVQRPAALSLSKSLDLAADLVAQGERSTARLTEAVRRLIGQHAEAEIDYVHFVDQDSLQPVETVGQGTVLALAVRIGGRVRLIDNGYVSAGAGQEDT
jgi:pantoate--beta-alanine ligase